MAVTTLVLRVPIVTTILCAVFAALVFRRWRWRRPAPHLFWWSLGIAFYGLGTLAEAYTTLFGWHEAVFRGWYVAGALLGGAPLAQGTVYLILPRRTADRMAIALALVVSVAASFVLLSPIDLTLVEAHRLTGRVMEWREARLFSPFINTYAVVFLVGGALLSAWRYREDPREKNRFIGNCYIAVGALLPGVGGAATRMGHTEVLYVTELIGIVLIWIGYAYNVGRTEDRGDGSATSSSPA